METQSPYITKEYIFPFKSYYVVWKPRTFSVGETAITRFKSYYVVWKPLNAFIALLTDTSLDRTMQYGNQEQTSCEK